MQKFWSLSLGHERQVSRLGLRVFGEVSVSSWNFNQVSVSKVTFSTRSLVISHFFLPAKMRTSANKPRQIFNLSYLFFEQQRASGWGLDMPYVTSERANMANTLWTVNINFQMKNEMTTYIMIE